MISYIKNLLYRTKNKDSLFSSKNRLEFILQDKEPNIKVTIIDTDDKSAQSFADLIYSLVTGLYTNSISNLLIELSEQDEDIKQFVGKVLFHYNLLQINEIKSKNHNNEPLIKPTEFLKYGK